MKVSYCERRIQSGRFLWAFALLGGPAYESVCRGVCGEGPNSPPQQKTSQKRAVSGDVTTPDGKPVPGATVSVKNRPDLGGVLTDTKGHFQLSVPDNSILIVSFLGYNTEEISVGKVPCLFVSS